MVRTVDRSARSVDGSTIIPLIVLGLILAPIYEETGWHGYGVDSLRARNGVMPATLQFAVLWCAWHAPLVLIPGTYQHGLAIMDNKIFVANFFVSIIPVAFVANWFYYRNDRSIAASILLHSMLNAASILIDAGQVAKCIATLLYSAIAAALVIGDQSLFAQGQRNFVSTRSPAPEGHRLGTGPSKVTTSPRRLMTMVGGAEWSSTPPERATSCAGASTVSIRMGRGFSSLARVTTTRYPRGSTL